MSSGVAGSCVRRAMARLSSHGDDSPSPFLAALRAVIVQWPAAEAAPRFLVAFSGGVDSTVLLAAQIGRAHV